MTKEELEKDYYADRPTEPYSDDDSPNDWANIAHYAEENLEKAFKRIAEHEFTNKKISIECHKLVDSLEKMQNKNVELKVKVGLSIDCEKAQKDGELCLGYGGDEDEPCERCKNCIKCECGYYQLGETEKDEQLTKAKVALRNVIDYLGQFCTDYPDCVIEAEIILKEE